MEGERLARSSRSALREDRSPVPAITIPRPRAVDTRAVSNGVRVGGAREEATEAVKGLKGVKRW